MEHAPQEAVHISAGCESGAPWPVSVCMKELCILETLLFCTRIPAEHLGAFLELSPSAFLFQSVGAQSEWSLKLLALEQPAWKILDGSELPVP